MSDLRYPTASPTMVKDIMEEEIVLRLDDFNDTVEVIVGKDEKELRLEFAKKILALDSRYFRIEIRNYSYLPHDKDQSMIIDLSEQNFGALEDFFAWNTTGTIFSSRRLSPVIADPNTVTITAEKLDKYVAYWDRLLESYFLADFLGAPAFGNAVIDALIKAIDSEREDRAKLEPKLEIFAPILGVDDLEDNQNHLNDAENNNENEEDDGQHDEDEWENVYRDPFERDRPRQESRQMLGTLPYQIQRVYSNTETCSPIRKMLVDKFIKQGIDHHPYYEKLSGLVREGMPVEFHFDLADEMMRSLIITNQIRRGIDCRRLSADSRARRRCLYHIHRVGERCPGLGYSDPNPEW
ncbi:hypothetical protein EAE96_001899 [Botrytis aclada]|nr:hypothetical protein EAE96_001899 [Botrytis aclada]